MKEEILQPPEPHPVPPILTPSPPSAFPTVTNVRQDNDRYHPKPVLHVLATAQNNTTSQNQEVNQLQNQSETCPNTESTPMDLKDQNLPQQTQTQTLDLNDNYNNKSCSLASTKSDSGASQSHTPSSPLSPVTEGSGPLRVERKLSIEIKKVPLQEGPRSFDTSNSLGIGPASSANSASMLQRSHAFKTRTGPAILTSSSSLSEDSGTEAGAGSCGESKEEGVLARPNHLPVKSSDKGDNLDAKSGLAAWSQPCLSPEKNLSKSSSSSSDRVPQSSSCSSHLSSSTSSSSSTPVRTALSFTNPLHSDNSDQEADAEMVGVSGCQHHHATNVSTVTAAMVTAPSSVHHGDQQQPIRKATPMSIAGQETPSPSQSPANPLEIKAAAAEWSSSQKDTSDCLKKTSPAEPAFPETTATSQTTDGRAELGGVR